MLEKRKRVKAREAAEKRALELGEEPPPKKIPRTIENTREFDETVCMPDDEELFAGNDVDEFISVLKQDRTPKILVTTCCFNSTRVPAFISDLLFVIPNSEYFKRGTYDLKIVEYAKNKDFTSLIVVHTSIMQFRGCSIAKSLSPSRIFFSSASASSSLDDGEATAPAERSLTGVSSSKANQLEFVKRDPL